MRLAAGVLVSSLTPETTHFSLGSSAPSVTGKGWLGAEMADSAFRQS